MRVLEACDGLSGSKQATVHALMTYLVASDHNELPLECTPNFVQPQLQNLLTRILVTMCRLAGGYIDLDKKYGAAFQGDHNALIRNIVTCKRSTTHHCPDCEVCHQSSSHC